MFYNILDTPAFNACVLFIIRPPVQGIDNSSGARFKFVCSFGEQLLKPNMLLRARYPNGLSLPTKNALKVFGVAVASKRSKGVANRHKNDAANYVHARDRKVKHKCSESHNHVCKQLSKELLYCYDLLKTRLKIEHFAEQQFLLKYNAFWLFLGY